MNSLNYLLQTNLYLALFMGFYTLVLRNETFFKQNRIFLNGSVVLSFLIPCINSNWFQELFITQKVREVTQSVPVELMYDPIIVQAGEESPQWTSANIITWAYLAGVALFLIRFIMQLIWLRYNLKEKKGSAFSFFRTLVVDSSLPEKETIINHEKVHIRQWHSADVILIELAAIINWFNPVIYLYKKEIRHIHEFIADEEAAGLQQSKSDYALILLSTTLGVNPHQLTNSFFNQSLIKRRIVMLGKNRSRRTGLLKYGLSAPLFAIMLIFSSATMSSDKKALIAGSKKIIETLSAADQPDAYKSFLNRNPAVKELAWKINPRRVIVYLKNGSTETYNMENPSEKASAINKYGEFPYPPPPPPVPAKPKVRKIITPIPPPIRNFSHVKVLPEFPGGEKEFGAFLSQNIKYPELARTNKITGRYF